LDTGGRGNWSRRPFLPAGGVGTVVTAEGRPMSASTTEELLERARAGDREAFGALVAPHRHELGVHCYRILVSVQDAEDVMQEVLLSAWQGIGGFEQRASIRTWLYRIATNRCLNHLRDNTRRLDVNRSLPLAPDPTRSGEVLWLEPCPDVLLEGLADRAPGPEARYEATEAVSLAFVTALQVLSPRQRSALILRDVLGFSAKETAETLETTVASANSALQRARASVEERLPEQSQQATLRALGDERLAEIVDGYMKAWERCDVDAVVGMLTEDACFSMPPLATWFGPRDEIETFLVGSPMSGMWRWKSLRVRSNGQVALAFYSWDDGEQAYLPFALNVLTFRGELISDVTAFIVNTPPPDDDREVIARMPEQPTNALSLMVAFQNFGLPERLD
jgi:RNA polymerase sigma-70 factor, ECF subfamily